MELMIRRWLHDRGLVAVGGGTSGAGENAIGC